MTGRFDDDPLDLEAVSSDDALVEQLRRSLSPDDAVVWGDDDLDSGESDDPSYALLRALQHDVSAELPTGPLLGAEVVPLRASRRSISRTATVAALTAGVLSVAGVAAAATSQPVRSAVADAVSTVVKAITPDAPVQPKAAHPAAASVSDTPTATITPPGQLVRTAARSAEAARFIGAALARADRLTKAGQYAAAGNLLDAAELRLRVVTATDGHVALRALLDLRRAELDQARAASGTSHKPATRPAVKPHGTRPPGSGGKSGTTQQPAERGPATAAPTPRTHSVPVRLPKVTSTHAADRATQAR